LTEIFWLEQSARDVPVSDGWLAISESARLATLRFPKRRDDWRLGRWTAKQAVASFLGLPSAHQSLRKIEIRPAPCGAPEVFLEDRPAAASISLSHRSGIALCAIAPSNTMLGCDLELIERRSSGFLHDFFTEEEQEQVAYAPAAQRDLLITMLWCSKESVLKALRAGLRHPTNSVLVRPLPKGHLAWDAFRAQTSTGQLFDGWWRECHGFLRSIAVPAELLT
jgi:4'-phosphopantetheinyl transferase